MEVKINKEIQSYSESMFLGLSMRQCGFSLAAILVAVGLYFLLKPYVGTETVSWMCILGAAPFAAMGFVNYHGMTAEQLDSFGAAGTQTAYFRAGQSLLQIIGGHHLQP